MLREILAVTRNVKREAEPEAEAIEDLLDEPVHHGLDHLTANVEDSDFEDTEETIAVEPEFRDGPDTDYELDWSGNADCLGELVVKQTAEPSDILSVYSELKKTVKTDILYIKPSLEGTSIFCAISDVLALLESLPRMPLVTRWNLSYR